MHSDQLPLSCSGGPSCVFSRGIPGLAGFEGAADPLAESLMSCRLTCVQGHCCPWLAGRLC